MSEEENNASESQSTFTKDDVQKLITDAVSAKELELKEHIKSLNDENKEKRLTAKEMKEALAKVLGLSEQEKDDKTLFSEKLSGLDTSIADLKKQLETEKAEKEKLQKQTKAIKAAEKFNFYSIEDAMKFINLDAENLEGEFKTLSEQKPYLLKAKDNIGGGVPPNTNNIPKDIDQQIADAINKKDFALSIALKNKKAGITK